MKKIILPLILILLGNCNDKEVDFNPKAIVIVRMGDVRAGGRVLSLSDEISDKDVVTVGAKSVCDLQILESDSLVVVRLKEYSRFKLSGKQIGSKKETNFILEVGNAMINVSKLEKNDGINAVSPVATAGVRGTKYDVSVSQNGTTKINVIEGSVAMKVHIPEMDKYSKADIKKSKALSTLNDSLESKEVVVEKGHSSEMPKGVGAKIFKESGLEEAAKKNKPEDLDKNVDIKALDEKIEKVENEELKIPVKEIDKGTMSQRLKEYEELTPIEKETINDKSKRKAVIQQRFQKWEKSWLDRLLDWTKKIKIP